MEWVALIVWVIIVMVGTPLGAALTMGAPGLGLQVFTAIAGLACCLLFIILDGGQGLAWGAVAAGVLGFIAVGLGVGELTDSDRPVSWAGQIVEENTALVAGIQLPLYLTVAAVSLAMALGVTTVG